MKTLTLLLDEPDNLYQQLLVRRARQQAELHGMHVQAPQYARGSSMAQMEQLLACTRGESRPDGILIMTAGRQSQLPAGRRAARAGLSLVFLNRVPPDLADLRSVNPDVLIAAVAPDQRQIGSIQAAQCLHLLPRGGFVLLVTGIHTSPSAIARQEGFLEGAGTVCNVHAVEGDWSEDGGYRALEEWFRLGAERERDIGLVVCQNDPMSRGARRALRSQAESSGRTRLAAVPVAGCDGLKEEGQAMVARGELAATVIMPPTAGQAVEMLANFWGRGERRELELLPAESFPPLDQMSPVRRD